VTGRPGAVAEGGWLPERIDGRVCTWGEHLAVPPEEETGRPLRRRESTARPLGDRNFVDQVSAATGRDSLPKKPGRKSEKETQAVCPPISRLCVPRYQN
jgi:hypothetical protein